MAIFPSPLGSKAKPIRGAGLNRCPFKHPALDEVPTLAAGNEVRMLPGITEVPPEPPHWTMPLNGLPAPGIKEPFRELLGLVVSEKIAGEPPATKAAGSRLYACL